jgi:YbbR domain-containing protein
LIGLFFYYLWAPNFYFLSKVLIMKKILPVLARLSIVACILLMSVKAFGQNSATIGTGTTSTTSFGNDPIDGSYNSFRYQVVYTAAELTAAGIPANATITALGFSIAGDYGGGDLLGYKIFMGHTNAANSAAHDNSPTSLVKSSFSYNPTVTVAGAFDLINFNSNFVCKGTAIASLKPI